MPQAATFGWQGGEPTLTGIDFFRRVVQYQQEYGRPGQYVSNGLQTNGTLIDDEWATLFSQYSFLLGISLDGPKQWHDHYRVRASGRGSYDRVMRGIEALRRHDAEFNILTVLNNITADHPQEIWGYMLEHGFNYSAVHSLRRARPRHWRLDRLFRLATAVRRLYVPGL